MVTTRLVGFAGTGSLFENMSIAAIEQSEIEKEQLTLSDFDKKTRRILQSEEVK